MDVSALFLLFIFSVLFAMLYNWGGAKFLGWIAGKSWGARISGSYPGRTLLTAVVVFVFVAGISLVMSAVYEKPKLPGA